MGIHITTSIILLLFFSFTNVAMSIYCGDDDCYDLLGLTQAATPSEVKKAYYKLSLKFHPDKNPDPEAHETFAKIATAYEILFDEEKRADYDYALAHPEQYFYNTARYYQAYYAPKTDLRAILVAILLIISVFQYLNDWFIYNNAIEHAKQTPAYKNKIKSLELERSGNTVSNKKKGKNKSRNNLAEVNEETFEVKIEGAEKPGLLRLVVFKFILLPYVIAKIIIWEFSWIYRYNIRKEKFCFDDASYLTRISMGFFANKWKAMDPSQKRFFISKRLWVKENMETFRTEMKRDNRKRR